MKAMHGKIRKIGCAKRIRVRTPLGTRCGAWDCRAFGLGRVVTPILPVEIELNRGVRLNVHTGEVRATADEIAA